VARKKLSLRDNPLLRGPSLETRSTSSSPYREIPLADIDIDPNQPRRVFQSEGLKELAASIKEHGILTPVLVRIGEHGTFQLVAGERRVRAAKLAGLSLIPAVVDSSGADEGTTLTKQLVENVQREDLTSMERAIAVGQLRDAYGWSIRTIAEKLGVSKGFVQRSLEILNLPDDLQAALIAGAAESKVLLLAGVEEAAKRKELLELIDQLTREELAARINQKSGSSKVYRGGTVKGAKNREDERIIADLQHRLGVKVFIARKKGKPEQGKISLEFYGQDDLSAIYEKLSAS